jgi:hypothetical protein
MPPGDPRACASAPSRLPGQPLKMSLQPSLYTIVDGERVRMNEFFPAAAGPRAGRCRQLVQRARTTVRRAQGAGGADTVPDLESGAVVSYRTIDVDGLPIFYREAGAPDAQFCSCCTDFHPLRECNSARRIGFCRTRRHDRCYVERRRCRRIQARITQLRPAAKRKRRPRPLRRRAAEVNLARRATAEAVGTALLLAAVVGSGITAQAAGRRQRRDSRDHRGALYGTCARVDELVLPLLSNVPQATLGRLAGLQPTTSRLAPCSATSKSWAAPG